MAFWHGRRMTVNGRRRREEGVRQTGVLLLHFCSAKCVLLFRKVGELWRQSHTAEGVRQTQACFCSAKWMLLFCHYKVGELRATATLKLVLYRGRVCFGHPGANWAYFENTHCCLKNVCCRCSRIWYRTKRKGLDRRVWFWSANWA